MKRPTAGPPRALQFRIQGVSPGTSLTTLLVNGRSVRLGYDAILNQDSAEHRVNLSVNAGF